METITVNVHEDIAREFREFVKQKLGKRKGVLGKSVEKALRKWIDEEGQKYIAERQIKMAQKGLYSLKKWKFNREEAHER